MIEHLIFLVVNENKCGHTVAFAGWREHECICCGCQYRYRIDRRVASRGKTPEAARKNATHKAENAQKSVLENRPCPTCGLYQPDMVAPRRFRLHVIIFVCLFLSLAAIALLALVACFVTREIPAIPGIVSYMAVASIAMAFLAHLVVDTRNPNAALSENQTVARDYLSQGMMATVKPGNELTSTNTTSAAAWRPTGQSVLHGVMILALAIAPCGEMVRQLRGWSYNRNCAPAVAGVGDQVKIDFPTTIKSVRGYWRGGGKAEIVNAADLGVPSELKLTASQDNWGNSITLENNSPGGTPVFLWAMVELPDDARLAGKTVEIKMDLIATYPESNGAGFQNKILATSHTESLVMAGDRYAGPIYLACFVLGLLGGAWLGLATSFLIAVRARSVRAKALPSTFLLDAVTPINSAASQTSDQR